MEDKIFGSILFYVLSIALLIIFNKAEKEIKAKNIENGARIIIQGFFLYGKIIAYIILAAAIFITIFA